MGRPFIPDSAADAEEAVKHWEDHLQACGQTVTADDSAFLHGLYAQGRTAYRFVLEAPLEQLSRRQSKVGGLPFLLPEEAWPRSTFHVRGGSLADPDPGPELTFVWQLDIADMPVEARRLLGCQEGLFQLFLDPDLGGSIINEDFGYYLARVLNPGQLALACGSAIPEHAEVLTEQLVTGWEAHDRRDYPATEDYLPPDIDLDSALDIRQDLEEQAGTLAGDKLLGWPRWCQGPEWGLSDTGDQYLHFMQLECEHIPELCIGDSGTLVVQKHPTDLIFRVGWACC